MSVFTASDRLGRLGFALRIAAISAVVWAVVTYCFSALHANSLAQVLVPLLSMIVWMLLLASTVFRRLHDMGRSATEFYKFWIPVLNLIFLADLLFRRGDLTVNQFGPAPAGIAGSGSAL
jgi:uncharacterized membrane protein YhaH (DUF805 family)